MSRLVDISPYKDCRIVLNPEDSGFPTSELPTVDAVEVVRCVKCKHNYEIILGPGCEPLWGLVCTKGPCVDCIVPEDFYCPYGERRSEQLEGEAQNE